MVLYQNFYQNSLDNYIYENIRSKNQFSLISIQSSALDYLWNKFEYWKQHTVSTYQICNQITNKIVIFLFEIAKQQFTASTKYKKWSTCTFLKR